MYHISETPTDDQFRTFFEVQNYLDQETVDQFLVKNVRGDRQLSQQEFDDIVSSYQRYKSWSTSDHDDLVESYCNTTHDYSVREQEVDHA